MFIKICLYIYKDFINELISISNFLYIDTKFLLFLTLVLNAFLFHFIIDEVR